MKNRNFFMGYLLTMLSLAAVPAFAASLENSDASKPDSVKPSVQNVMTSDSAKLADTVFSLRIDRPREVINSINKYTDTMTQRGYGGGGGPMAGVFAVNIKPFIDLAERVSPLRGKNFSFGELNYKAFFMSGGMGFVGVGNGLRLGGGGMSGVLHFPSNRYAQDSIINYSTKISWGGFLIEKLVATKKYSYTIGGYIGSGSFDADWVEINEAYSAFNTFKSDDNDEKIKAFFGFFEVHTGIVYHIARFMHFSGDVSLPLLVSSDGFAPFTKEFISISPGVRIRFIFGNLG